VKKVGVADRAHARSIIAYNVLLTVRMRIVITSHLLLTVCTHGHEMATLNATKLLLLTNQPKLTPTITRTLTDTVMVIFFTCISLTHIKRLHCINERNFSRRCVVGFMGGPIFLPICDNTSGKKSIVHTLWGKYV